MVQLSSSYGLPSRCWVLRGVELRGTDQPNVPYWLNRDKGLNGFMVRVPVHGNDVDDAARAAGFASAKDCDRDDPARSPQLSELGPP